MSMTFPSAFCWHFDHLPYLLPSHPWIFGFSRDFSNCGPLVIRPGQAFPLFTTSNSSVDLDNLPQDLTAEDLVRQGDFGGQFLVNGETG